MTILWGSWVSLRVSSSAKPGRSPTKVAYEGGRPSQNEGRNLPSRFTILHVRDVLDEGVPRRDVAPLPHTDVVHVAPSAGTPVVKSESLLPGIRSALRAGYSPRSVLLGLGMWDSEGFRSPRQIEEWVQKAARHGPEPSYPMSVPDLLAEGHTRYRAHLAR